MILQRAPTLRHTTLRGLQNLRALQKRWAQVHDVRFVATHQQGPSIAEKYKDKLQKKARA